MGSDVRHVRGEAQKELVKKFEVFTSKGRSRWQGLERLDYDKRHCRVQRDRQEPLRRARAAVHDYREKVHEAGSGHIRGYVFDSGYGVGGQLGTGFPWRAVYVLGAWK